jgi:hypothetical protein
MTAPALRPQDAWLCTGCGVVNTAAQHRREVTGRRDTFAAAALTGLLPARDPQGRTAFTEMTREECAKAAYELADAMLAAREGR